MRKCAVVSPPLQQLTRGHDVILSPPRRVLTVIAVTITACTDAPTESALSSSNTIAFAAKGGSSEVNKTLAEARASTARYYQVSVAEAAGYENTHECVEVPGLGGMGTHYVNMELLLDPSLDPSHPEVLVYEPQKNGRLKLVALEYIIPKPMWDAMNPGVRPTMFGKEYEDGPMNTYALHAWVWENNPSGILSAFTRTWAATSPRRAAQRVTRATDPCREGLLSARGPEGAPGFSGRFRTAWMLTITSPAAWSERPRIGPPAQPARRRAMRSTRIIPVVMAAAVLSSGCIRPELIETTEFGAVEMAPLAAAWNAELGPQGESTSATQLRGRAALSPAGSASSTATLSLEGAELGTWSWGVHMGACGESVGVLGGQTIYPELRVGSDGRGEATATIPGTMPNRGEFFVQLHRRAGEGGESGSPTCVPLVAEPMRGTGSYWN